MPSTTVPSNRTLPAWLLRRLDEVATHHGGQVPLHGRLFAQWMHHAYPRECRYPHVSGTTDPLKSRLTVDNYKDNSATKEEMQRFINVSTSHERFSENATVHNDAEEGCPMWTMEEELVVWRPTAPVPEKAGALAVLRGALLVGTLASALAAVRARSIVSEASGGRTNA